MRRSAGACPRRRPRPHGGDGRGDRAALVPAVGRRADRGRRRFGLGLDVPAAGGGARSRCSNIARAARSMSARVRGRWPAVLIAAGLLAGAVDERRRVVGFDAGEQQDDVTRRIAERRMALRAGRDGRRASRDPARVLERRKHQTASSVIVLEVLSQMLPDHTYVTELRIEGRKLQIIGVTRDAPALIRLIEHRSHFTRATFFAPTTRSQSDPGERFHIEAQIEPVFTPRT